MSVSLSRTYPDAACIGVGAVVWRDGKILLVRRARPPAAGLWAVPGGGVRLGETLQQAAEREMQEELGIRVRAREPVYAFDLIQRDEAGRVEFHYVVVDLRCEYVAGDIRPNEECLEAGWFAPDEVPADLNEDTRRFLATWSRDAAAFPPCTQTSEHGGI